MYEMLHSYVKQCDSEHSVEGFLSFNLNNLYHMNSQLILNYVLPRFIFYKGDCSNNVQIQNAGCYKFSELFYCFNHPIYQEIEYLNLLQKVMPKEVKELRDKNITYTQSLKEKKQGADFILENKVKCQKCL